MEVLSNAVLGELVSRSISYLLSKCDKRMTSSQEDDLQRLRHLLLQSGTIVEEAEWRHVANRAMPRQFQALRDEMFRGHYIADTVSSRVLLRGGCRNDDKFNPAKRIRFLSSDRKTTAALISSAGPRELQQMVRSLETMIGNMKEFAVFLTRYPPLHRQPYSAHLFLDKCMFGRQMEREMIMEFLLQFESPAAGNLNLGVLPIIGPAHIGKSTLVEHICQDERVSNHFSSILVYNGNNLKDSSMATLIDNCAIKHQNDKALGERQLIIIELLEDVDEETWKRLYYYSERSLAEGSKIIITSRSETIARLGTTQALRLRSLSAEAYWYFFKMLVFGSDDPGQHPKMASLALEMAQIMQGSFMFAYIGAVLLRAHFNSQTWSRILTRLKQYMQKNVSIIGEYPDDVKAKNNHRCTWSLIKQKPDKYFMLDDVYQKGPAEEEIPSITMADLMSGCAEPRGKTKILFWRSQIPPYFTYMCTSVTREIRHA
ncbi:hypothetical protein PR202_gb01592 [Eleusine coracana subsp. coracana]|uniref:NB-ARC domain-containing protein n=1 Tax=Eleusine coracana subsp. coracana TaxID=191504 RepID=A0AAV5DX17_ELECO|nr:hypothetical protein PR202_gb01592 [Eleusine coracana subsp. coracana]